MNILLSFISLLVIITVTFILLYQNTKVKDNVAQNLRTVVDQINDSSYIGYERDRTQNDNLKVLESNIRTLSNDVDFLSQKVGDNNIRIDQEIAKMSPEKRSFGKHVNFKDIHFGNEDWIYTIGNDNTSNLYGGIATKQLYTQDGAYIAGQTYANSIDSDIIRIKGAYSEYNSNNKPTIFNNIDNKNQIAGDTHILGNAYTTGTMKVMNDLDVRKSIQTNMNTNGPFFTNISNDGRDKKGFANNKEGDFRIFNTNGQISFGNTSSEEPHMILRKNQHGPQLLFGNQTNPLSLLQVQPYDASFSPASAPRYDFILNSVNSNNNIVIQAGQGDQPSGIVVTSNMIGIGTYPEHASLDVNGNVNIRGTQISLGKDKNVLAKNNNNELVMNQNKSFENIIVQSDLSIQNDSCIELGKGDLEKSQDAAKICYKKYSNGLDITGATTGTGRRTITMYDDVKTTNINASKLCLGETCIDELTLQNIIRGNN